LDRVGSGTGSAGDEDLAYCSIDLGMGIGTFCRLEVTHLIPQKRLTVDYIARLSAGINASGLILRSLRPSTQSAPPKGNFAAIRLSAKFYAKLAISSRIDRKIALAAHAGRRSGRKFLQDGLADKALIQH
jgi:hypothetical protein